MPGALRAVILAALFPACTRPPECAAPYPPSPLERAKAAFFAHPERARWAPFEAAARLYDAELERARAHACRWDERKLSCIAAAREEAGGLLASDRDPLELHAALLGLPDPLSCLGFTATSTRAPAPELAGEVVALMRTEGSTAALARAEALPPSAESHALVAGILTARGEYVAAIARYDAAIARAEQEHGNDAPEVGLLVARRANLRQARRLHGPALKEHRRALAIFTKAFGADHPRSVDSRLSLGFGELMIDVPDEAIERLEPLLPALEGDRRAAVEYTIARALLQLGRTPERAVALLLAAERRATHPGLLRAIEALRAAL